MLDEVSRYGTTVEHGVVGERQAVVVTIVISLEL
jgi:hypothetical protein